MSHLLEVSLPDIGEGVVEGEVVQWLKEVGDLLSQDEPVVAVMTDKATVELPAPSPGKLARQCVKVGQMAKVGAPLYVIETEQATVAEPSKVQKTPAPTLPTIPSPLQSSSSVLATPPTRKLAKELGIDLASVKGSGKEGRITEGDVVAFHAGNGTAVQLALPASIITRQDDDKEKPIVGLRNFVAKKMVESKQIIPHFSYFDRLDASRLVKMRTKILEKGEKEGIHVTYMPLLIRALSLVLKEFPEFNSSFDLEKNALLLHPHHHIGIAVSSKDGLIVAVLKNVEQMSLEQVIRDYDALMCKVKEGKLERSDLIGSTITISNFGPFGGRWATPIINYPEVAILGIARIMQEAIVKGEAVKVCPMMNLSWSFDHRVIDGKAAAEFSNTLIEYLENPIKIL